MAEKVIELKNISKKYRIHFSKRSLTAHFLSLFKKNRAMRTENEIWAVQDLNISINEGESVGIIGENASGKTTILRIISGITVPTAGTVKVHGKVAGLLDLGAGFHAELTGRENIYLDAALYGLGRKEVDVIYERIADFSGLGEFIDAQIKTYSQGMLVRLGFSIAVHIEPDIFLIDDSLAVGDEEFQRKCIHKITELREKGKTVIIVSHDLDSLSRVCQRGILIKGGKVLKDDSMPKVIAHYVEAVGDENAITSIDKERLSVIFNSGRIILLWDGKPLTKSFGGYISLQVLDTWLLSWKARWQVVEKSAHYFSVEGKWEKYDLKTNIQVHLHSERRFSWRSRVQVGAHMDARKMIMGLMLENVYDYYYDDDTLKKADTFSFSSKRWRDIYRTDEENAALILKTDINLPAVVIAFKKSSDGGFQLIQKTDSVLDAIAAQTHIILSQSAQENNGQTSSVHCEADIELADAESVEQIIINERVRNKAEHKLLRLAVRGKNLHIFFNGLRLTYGKGLEFGFGYEGGYCNILDGAYQVEKKGPQTISISSLCIGNRTELNVFIENNKIHWRFHVGTRGNLSVAGVTSLKMELFADQRYGRYFSAQASGSFSGTAQWSREIDIKNTPGGYIGLSAEDARVPWLVSTHSTATQVRLFDGRGDFPARLISAVAQDSSSFEGEIVILESRADKENYLLKQKEGVL